MVVNLAGSAEVIFGLVTLMCGILIVCNPKLLSYIVGAYLIIVGLVAILQSV